MEQFLFVSRRAPAASPLPAASRAAAINRIAIPAAHLPSRAAADLAPWLGALGVLLLLVQLGLRRRAGRIVLPALLLLLGMPLFAAPSYDDALRRGLLADEAGDLTAAVDAFDQAVQTADHDEDREFAALLRRETARKAGIFAEPEARPEEHSGLSEVHQALLAGDRKRAEELYRRQLAAETDPETLLELAAEAAGGAFPDVAEAALLRAGGLPGDRYWPAMFQLVKLYRAHGDVDRAMTTLREWTADAGADAAVLLPAGDLCEQMGRYDDAAEFYARAGVEEAQIRMAMLEETRDNFDAAARLWRGLALDGPGGMRSLQAVERLVELYRKHARLEELCGELAAPAAADGAPEELAALYARALAVHGDSATLFAFLEAKGLHRQMLNYRLELRHYPEAVELLRRDMAANPEHRDDALQKLALVAVETQDVELARECLAQLGDARLEFAGAVYALVGDHRNAAECYRRAAELTPENAELLLLWARSKDALGDGAEALAIFLAGLAPEVPAERFGVMVDGLLNLGAPAATLQTALAAALARIDREPENLFYYQLAEDLAEELGDDALGRRLERMQLAVAPERRALLLQKLFLDARRRGASAEALYYGRILISFPDRYSPALYDELGQLLVAEGCLAEAERCMRDADRADEGGDKLMQLAEILSRRMLFEDAERIYRELLALSPNRPELMTRYAMMMEFQGRYAEAAEVNLEALQLLDAPRTETAKSTRHGSEQAELARRFAEVAGVFANQAILFPERFVPEVEGRRDAAPNQVRRDAWQSVLDRIALLNGDFERLPPREEAPRREPPRERSVPDLRAPDADVAEFFARLPEGEREIAWLRLVRQLDFEPAPAVSERLIQEMNAMPLRGLTIKWELPFAAEVKRAYAERLLSEAPDDPDRLAFAARTRHLAGDAFAAGIMAEMIYDEVEQQPEITIPDINMLLDLTRIYAAVPDEEAAEGVEALTGLIEVWEEKIRLDGDTAARRLLLGVFHYALEDYDRAQECWLRAWDFNRDAYPYFWVLQSAVKRSGRWEDWSRSLLERQPGDQTAMILYTTQLIPYLRLTGNRTRALELIHALNPALQRKERLLLAARSGDQQELAGEFMAFLRAGREQGGSYAIYEQDPYSGGIRGHLAGRNSRFRELALRVPECRPYLEYLLQGLFPNQHQFAVLLDALKAMPGPAPEGETLAMLILRDAAAPETLSEAARGKLRYLAEHYQWPPAEAAEPAPILPADPGACRNYLLTATGYPDWESMARQTGDLSQITAAFAAALEELGSTRMFPQAELVRHYALLAAYDLPERRADWLEAAFRHHDRLGEASLWLYDALVLAGDAERALELRRRLQAEKRFPEFRTEP